MEFREYDVVSFTPSMGEEMKVKLNQMGGDGWRVISVTPILGPPARMMGPAQPGEAAVTRELIVVLERRV